MLILQILAVSPGPHCLWCLSRLWLMCWMIWLHWRCLNRDIVACWEGHYFGWSCWKEILCQWSFHSEWCWRCITHWSCQEQQPHMHEHTYQHPDHSRRMLDKQSEDWANCLGQQDWMYQVEIGRRCLQLCSWWTGFCWYTTWHALTKAFQWTRYHHAPVYALCDSIAQHLDLWWGPWSDLRWQMCHFGGWKIAALWIVILIWRNYTCCHPGNISETACWNCHSWCLKIIP